MKYNLSAQEKEHLERRTAEAEERTGAQIVLAVIERSDAYPELPWKAFALGAAAGGLAAVVLELLQPGWSAFPGGLRAVILALGAGAACAFGAVVLPGFARLFLDGNRAEMEIRQYAESLFLSREIFATSGRRGVLVLVSLFEHRVVVLPDRGLRGRLGTSPLREIIAPMTAALAAGRVGTALEQGLTGVERVVGPTGAVLGGENELSDRIIEERGP